MPLTNAWSYLLPPFLALALVGGLALVLKWAFNDVVEPDDPDAFDAGRATVDSTATPDVLGPEPVPPTIAGQGDVHTDALSASALTEPPPTVDGEDYGLLSVVTVADSADAALAATALLAEAGIRATTAIGPDGRTRVLVFDTDVFRARRVVGWPA